MLDRSVFTRTRFRLYQYQTTLVCTGTIYDATGVPPNTARGLVEWNGRTWRGISPQVNVSPYEGNALLATQVDDCPRLFVHGWYYNHLLGKWNGSAWRQLADGLGVARGVIWGFTVVPGVAVPYSCFAEFQNQIYVGADFTQAGGQNAAKIAVWDESAWANCAGDVTRDDVVEYADLIAVITSWGICHDCDADPAPCGGDGVVNVTDLLTVITQWGPCQ